MAEPRKVVGREQELRLLWDFVGGDRARVVLLEGDAGIGKTTLMREAITAASNEGARVLAARPAAAEAGLAFAGLGDLLADVLQAIVTELPPPQAAALEVAFLRRKAEGRSVDLHTVSAGVLAALRALGERDAVVVAVDDLQWLDRETVAALAFAFRRLGDERVRLIAALRRDHGRALPALIESLPPERITRIQIGSLSVGTLHEVIRIHAGRTLPRPVLLRIHELTDGNPFYALEIVRSLPPHEPPSGFQMPPSVEALTTRRLGRLEGPVRRVLEPAALLRDPTVSLLEALSKEPRQVDQRLDRAVSAGVIELSVDRIRFTHPLLAEAMATMIGPRRRSQLHAELAQLVEDPEQRARHLALVSSRPCTETADEIERGARVAAARGAPAAAAELLEMAAAVTPDSQPSSRWRRTIEAARACKPAGLPARGRKLLATSTFRVAVRDATRGRPRRAGRAQQRRLRSRRSRPQAPHPGERDSGRQRFPAQGGNRAENRIAPRGDLKPETAPPVRARGCREGQRPEADSANRAGLRLRINATARNDSPAQRPGRHAGCGHERHHDSEGDQPGGGPH